MREGDTNMIMTDELKNKQVREAFLNYYKSNYKPSLSIITEEIGISYAHFLKFKNERLDLSDKLLERIVQFLAEQEQKTA